jgi:hypothetical protein
MLDEVKKNFPNTRHWVPAYNMASEYYDHPLEINPKTGKGFQALADYDGIYEMTSHYVHVTAISSMANYYSSPFRTAKRDKEEDRGILALHFSLVYVYEICIILGANGIALSPRMWTKSSKSCSLTCGVHRRSKREGFGQSGSRTQGRNLNSPPAG